MHGSGTFPPQEHLRRGADFRRLYDQGRRCAGRLLVIYVAVGTAGGRRIGVVTSRRVGNAVARNRARRLMREAYRLNKLKLPEHIQLVMIARTAIRGASFHQVQAEMLALWGQAAILVGS